jgi:hypothetical protein
MLGNVMHATSPILWIWIQKRVLNHSAMESCYMMDLNPDKSVKSQMKSDSQDDDPPYDPDDKNFFKMIKMGLPLDAVKHSSVNRDGKDPAIILPGKVVVVIQ